MSHVVGNVVINCFVCILLITFCFYRDNIFAGLQIKLGPAGTVSAKNQTDSDSMSVMSLGQQSQMETKAEKRKKKHAELLKSKVFFYPLHLKFRYPSRGSKGDVEGAENES